MWQIVAAFESVADCGRFSVTTVTAVIAVASVTTVTVATSVTTHAQLTMYNVSLQFKMYSVQSRPCTRLSRQHVCRGCNAFVENIHQLIYIFIGRG